MAAYSQFCSKYGFLRSKVWPDAWNEARLSQALIQAKAPFQIVPFAFHLDNAHGDPNMRSAIFTRLREGLGDVSC